MGEDPREDGQAVETEQRTPEQIEADIERTRRDMGDTVAAVAEKADVKGQAKAKVDDAKARLQGCGPGLGRRRRRHGRARGEREPAAADHRRRGAGRLPAGPRGGGAGVAMQYAFRPIGIVLGIVSGLGAKKLFDFIWGKFDEEEAPNPEHREINWTKFIAAMLVEGAIFRLIRGFVDHHSRRAFAGLTGTWPGQEEPEPE